MFIAHNFEHFIKPKNLELANFVFIFLYPYWFF